MAFKDLRFQGFYIHEDDGYSKALKIVTAQNDPSKDHLRPPPNDMEARAFDNYQKAVATFGTDYKEFGNALLRDAKAGGKIDRADLVTLARAENIYAHASAAGIKTAFNAAKNLEEGHSMYGKQNGLSLTRQIMREAGIDENRTEISRGVSLEFRTF